MTLLLMAVLDRDGTVLGVGGAADGLALCVGRPVQEAPFWSHSPAVQAELEAALRAAWSGPPQRLHTTVRVPDERLRVVELSLTRLRGAEDRLGLHLSEAQPGRESVLEALRESHRQLATLMASLPGMVYRCANDADWSLTFASEGCLALTGYPASALVAREVDFAQLIHPQDRDAVWEGVQAGVDGRRPYQLEYRIVDRAGHPKWVWEQGQAIRGPDDGVQFLEGFILDVTERRAAQEELRRAHRLQAVGRVAGGIAHDFNNLLSGLIGWSELLRRRIPTGQAELEEPLDEIMKLCRRGAALSRQLLAFSRGRVVEKRRLQLGRAIQEMVPLLRRLIRESIALEVEADDQATWIEIDPSQLDQLVLNLCLNARDAMLAGGTLSFRARSLPPSPEGGPARVELVVADTGSGMDEETAAAAFEPFFTTKEEGTGLGLAIVADIIHQCGGRCELWSRPGQGTRFTIVFPACSPERSVSDPAPRGGIGRRVKILMVEDDDAVRTVVGGLLESQGYTVIAEASPERAIEQVSAGAEVDLLLTDVVMPNLGGYDLAQRLQALLPALRVVYMSGYAPDERVQRSVDEGRAGFLSKPFTLAQLIAKLESVLA